MGTASEEIGAGAARSVRGRAPRCRRERRYRPALPFQRPKRSKVSVSSVSDRAIAIALVAGGAIGAPGAVAVTGVVLSTLGTTLFCPSVDGRAWYAAHAVAMPFLCAAFLFASRGGDRSWRLGVVVGLATLARLPIAAATPALA